MSCHTVRWPEDTLIHRHLCGVVPLGKAHLQELAQGRQLGSVAQLPESASCFVPLARGYVGDRGGRCNVLRHSRVQYQQRMAAELT